MLDKSSPCGLEVHQSPGLELHVVIYRSVFLFVILFYIKYSHEFNNLPLSLVWCSHHRARENAQHLKNSLACYFLLFSDSVCFIGILICNGDDYNEKW